MSDSVAAGHAVHLAGPRHAVHTAGIAFEAATCPHELELARAQVAASACFSVEALAALGWVIVAIDSFTRVSIASGLPPRRRKN